MNKGTFFPNGVFLVLLAKDTFDVAGANADVAADDRRATAAASKNFIVMIEFYFCVEIEKIISNELFGIENGGVVV